MDNGQLVFAFASSRPQFYGMFHEWLQSGKVHDLEQREAVHFILKQFIDSLCLVHDEEKLRSLVKQCFAKINKSNARSVLTDALKRAVADHVTDANRYDIDMCIKLYSLQLTDAALHWMQTKLNLGDIGALSEGILNKNLVRLMLEKLLSDWTPVSSHWFLSTTPDAELGDPIGPVNPVGPDGATSILLAVGVVIVIWLATAAPTR